MQFGQRPAGADVRGRIGGLAGLQTQHSGVGDHDAVVGAPFCLRIDHLGAARAELGEFGAQVLVGCDAADGDQAAEAGLFERAPAALHQRADGRGLEGARQVGALLLVAVAPVVAVAASQSVQGVQRVCLQAAETDLA